MNLIISGSVTSGYGIPEEILRWDKVFAHQVPGNYFVSVCKDGMTHEDALKILNEGEFGGEILILYFGTRMGWPKLGKRIGTFLPYKRKNQGYLDIPAYRSRRKGSRMRRILKRTARVFMKSLGILLRQYKPELPIDKTLNDLDLLLTMTAKKFTRVIYIQHHHLSTRRLKYESKKYEKFYECLLTAVRTRPESNIFLVEMPKNIFTTNYFLPDSVHFNEQGHYEFGCFLAKEIFPNY